MTEIRKNILVADDDAGALLIMRATLEAAGFAVTTAADGREAMRSFQEQEFDLVMLDVDMPVMGGHEACAALRLQAGALLPIVMVTGMDDVQSIDTAFRAGATDFITKPISWALMGHRARYLLRNSQIALELRTAEAGIRRLLDYDFLTGLPNRSWFMRRLATAVETARREARGLAVLYIDLDNFKRVNDTLGHRVGDELLIVLTKRLRDELRLANSAEENLSRLGGDEFVVLLTDTHSPAQAGIAAERVLREISKPIRLAGHEVTVTPSIGIAVFPENGQDETTLMKNADLAMFFSKRRAPGGLAVFDATMSEGALRRLTIERELAGAIARNELSLEYQPQFHIRTGRIAGMEALLRWRNRQLGAVPPSEFIPVAEHSRLMPAIGEWVLRNACVQAKEWQDEASGQVVRLAVNVSGLQLAQADFAAVVSKVLMDTGLPAKLLELEITESVIMEDDARAIAVLHELKAIGVEIAIDDFGTGHSSFARLRDFPLDRLKIDRAFIQHAHTEAADHAIVSGILRMARALDIEVVAEGVEEHAQLLLLQDELCTLAQGYLLSRPLSAAAALALLQRSREAWDHTRTQQFNRLLLSFQGVR